ncbi:MAG TPA: class II fructose-bisphosphate aldolase [Candidatus Binataceae bacterium]|nr:class II fructose-bisphosphate aldolase [Candidatus Binataceae bacterium]
MRKLIEVLKEAQRDRIGVGHFNFSELAAFKAVVESARKLKVPVMVGVSEGERDFVGVRQASALVASVRDETGLEIFLNADHTHSIGKAEEAARAGFDEIIFDGSSMPVDQNIEQTKKAVEAIKSINPNIVVEGEIGYIGTSSSILEKVPEGLGALTTPDEAREFVDATGVDILAPAVGNMHGLLKSMVAGTAEKRLDIGRIEALAKSGGVLMTLHGGSGTNDGDFQKAIKAGITIVHVNTELRLAWRRGMDHALTASADEVVPYKILPMVVQEVAEVVEKRLRLFNFQE